MAISLSSPTTPEHHSFRAPNNMPRRWMRDFYRRPLIVKQLAVLSLVAAVVVPYLLFAYWSAGSVDEEKTPTTFSDAHPYWDSASHWDMQHAPPPVSHTLEVQAVAPTESATPPSEDAIHESSVVEPVTFALIMWSEDSASEGAILVKSIIMYTSAPVHIHIIADESAQVYLEKRLALVKHPRHRAQITFYRPSLQSMLDRIEREGTITTVHAAGVPGLMKLFIHEILPSTVSRAIFIDTDAFFVSDPALLWAQFDTFNATHAFSMPSHPEMAAPEWFNANRICSCVMLLDLSRLRALHLMHSSLAPPDSSSPSGSSSLSRPAFSALFGSPDPTTGKYPPAALGDQTFWWALIEHAPYAFKHLHYNWEVSACLLDMYGTSLGLGHDIPEAEVKMGNDDAGEEEELKVQLHTWETPHQGEVILPKLVHFNCLEGPRYHEWSGWDDPKDSLARRWAPAVRYHAGYKWLWLNQQTDAGAESGVVVETVLEPGFADERSS